MKLGVLVVDVQQLYFSSAFTWRNLLQRRRFLSAWRTVLQTFQDDYCLFVEMFDADKTINELREIRVAPTFTKKHTDAFEDKGFFYHNGHQRRTSLTTVLDRENIDTLLIGGLYGHACVYSTAAGAAKKGYDVHLARDLIDRNMLNNINFYKERTTVHKTHRELIKILRS